MSRRQYGLFELGSNSLKFYRVSKELDGTHSIETTKVPWRVAHEFFTEPALRVEMVNEVLSAIRTASSHSEGLPLEKCLCLATGVFRELPEMRDLAERVQSETGVRVRVIGGRDEAKLMARTFTAPASETVLLGDLGGATTEWARIDAGRLRDCGSVRLGAIRNHCRFARYRRSPEEFARRNREYCDAALAELPISPPTRVLATGGTAKALARISGSDSIAVSQLRDWIDRVARHGAPEELDPSRREVLLPGLFILERLAERCGASAVEYARTSVREGMANRLVNLLDKRRPDDLHATLLLHTSSQLFPKSE